jgi:renalase
MNLKNIAIVGAGIAGVTCARTLQEAGHSVQVFEKSRGFGGRMSTRQTPFGSFDHGAQYFTVRDARFKLALDYTRAIKKSSLSTWPDDKTGDASFVATPGMNALVSAWAKGLDEVTLETRVEAIATDALQKNKWQLHTLGPDQSVHVYGGFDAVVLAIPSPQARALLEASKLEALAKPFRKVTVAPCWTLMVAFPQAADSQRQAIGPKWNAQKVDHPRVAWVARESSKPRREPIERWTLQASVAWSQEHLEDDAETVSAKLQKAFAEVTGIRAEPSYAEVHRWRYAQTGKPLGQSHLWNEKRSIGICGDWCIGHRVEDGFVSGLELALTIAT